MGSLARAVRTLLPVALLALGAGSVVAAKVTVTGPANVPDFTEYAYAASGCKNRTWSVSDPVGTISSGQGTQHAAIAWGQGPKAVDVSAVCGKECGSRHVKVMRVTIADPPRHAGRLPGRRSRFRSRLPVRAPRR